MFYFLNEAELIICDGRKLVSKPEWARDTPRLKQRSVIDNFIVRMELSWTYQTSKRKCVIRIWCLIFIISWLRE